MNTTTPMHTPISKRRLARWNQRQRKKFHAGEFQELGFTLALRFSKALDAPALDAFHDDLFAVLDAQGLIVGGLGGALPLARTTAFVAAWRGSVSEAQRDTLLDWLRTRPEVAEARASAWEDCWRGSFTDPLGTEGT